MNLAVSNYSFPLNFAKKNKPEEKKNHLQLSDNQKKIVKGLTALAIAGAATAVIVGKNPSRAKVKTGSSLIKDKLYLSAQEEIDTLLSKKGPDYKINLEDFQILFKKQGKYDFEEALDVLSTFASKEENSVPKNVQKSLDKIKETITSLIKTRESSLETLEGIDSFSLKKIQEESLPDIEILKSMPAKENSPVLRALKILEDTFNPEKSEELSFKLNAFEICPKEILPKDGIYYHGTKSARKIFKNGLNPFESTQVKKRALQREGGAACYLTPDRKVASAFSAPLGQILPYKMDEEAVSAIGSRNSYENLRGMIIDFIDERSPEADFPEGLNLYAIGKNMQRKMAMSELLTRKIILDNGFDNVFLSKGIAYNNKTSIGNVNLLIGRPQSQMIVYSPEKIHLMPRSLKGRLLDLKEGAKGSITLTKNSTKGLLDFIAVARGKKDITEIF